ncbi:MAG TPA: CopG family transcriptional regulator [Thermoanaerobaculia bacterium]|nr:CopG family transcriptional regulator [Thermoanaerobaculia bacterium]
MTAKLSTDSDLYLFMVMVSPFFGEQEMCPAAPGSIRGKTVHCAQEIGKLMYGVRYGMKKTTIYLPDELKAEIERIADAEKRSEADFIREAILQRIATRKPPAPRIPLFETELADPTVAERVEELLEGFGE